MRIPINRAQIVSVYSGKAGKCTCGCAGNHSAYPATISRTLRVIAQSRQIAVNDNNFTTTIGDRVYIAYRKA